MNYRNSIALLAIIVGLFAVSQPRALAQQDDAPRKVVSRVLPVYPELARRMNISGTVRLQVTIAPNGRLKSAQVVGGHPVLAKAATDAVEKWKWEPGPHETTEAVELTFRPE
ncbi:MAG TPA: energy transducer TonB [Terriglobales bacterium]|nr:energy transducer TonB [Terriglobales bacterium]